VQKGKLLRINFEHATAIFRGIFCQNSIRPSSCCDKIGRARRPCFFF